MDSHMKEHHALRVLILGKSLVISATRGEQGASLHARAQVDVSSTHAENCNGLMPCMCVFAGASCRAGCQHHPAGKEDCRPGCGSHTASGGQSDPGTGPFAHTEGSGGQPAGRR